jgi:hypothetical protein
MHTTRHQTTQDPVTGLLAELTAVTDQLLAAVSDAEQARMATAGSALAASDRLMAAVVQMLSRVTHRGVIADEGVSVGAWLRTFAGRTSGDEKMLAACVDRLADMPTVSAWLASGEVSWPVVRSIVLATRNLTREQRRWVDATLAGDADRVRRLDPDRVVAAVDGLVNQARPDLHRDRERRGERDEWLRLQDHLDGGVTGQFQFGPESADQFRRALAATTPPDPHDDTDTDAGDDVDGDPDPADVGGDDNADHAPEPDPDADGDVDTDTEGRGVGGDLGGYDRWRRGRERANARALIALANQRLGLAGGSAPSAAKPSLLILADINALTGDGDGVGSATARLVTLSTRGPVELTAAAAQRLACDATWRVVFTDGDQILGVTAAHPKVSATLRAALVARDGGCRFPACMQPPELCDNHHVIPVKAGGPTVLENLALICTAHHHAIHDSHWTNTLHADATLTFTRRGVTITSAPRGHQRLRPATPPPAGRPRRRRGNQRCTDPTTADLAGHIDVTGIADPDPPPVDLPF